jgi:hypothetical protein
VNINRKPLELSSTVEPALTDPSVRKVCPHPGLAYLCTTPVSTDFTELRTCLGTCKTDWELIEYDGGSVGEPGFALPMVQESAVEELTKEEDDRIIREFSVSLGGPGTVELEACQSGTFQYTLKNRGTVDDLYELTWTSTLGLADFTSVPAALFLAAGESASFDISITIPDDAPAGTADELVIRAASASSEHTADTVETKILVVSRGDVDGDGLSGPCQDPCPGSDTGPTIVIGACDTGVANRFVESGCTMADLIENLREEAKNHGAFVSGVAKLTNEWKKAGIISAGEMGRIQGCAAESK